MFSGWRKAGVGAAQLFGNGGVGDGKTAHVDFVDDGVGECDAQPAIAGPVERRIDDDGLGNAGAAVLIVLVQVRILAIEGVGKDGLVPLHVANDGLCVGVDEQFVLIEAMTLGGVPRAVDAKAVALTRADARQEAVPDEGGTFFEATATSVCVVSSVIEAELDPGRVLRIDGEKLFPGRSTLRLAGRVFRAVLCVPYD